MLLPKLKELNTSRQIVDTFKGYNHNLRISEGEFFEMENMTSDYYPILAPRGKRGVYASPEHTNGIIAKDELCYVDGTAFVIGEDRVEMGLTDGPKQLTSMGAYVIIMPDKKYINTASPVDRGDIEATFVFRDVEGQRQSMTITPSTITGEALVFTSEETAPTSPKDGAVWADKSTSPITFKRYAESSNMWTAISPTYLKLKTTGIGKQFRKYDSVTISNVPNLSGLEKYLVGNKIVQACGDDYIVVECEVMEIRCLIDSDPDGDFTFKREMPAVDFLIESENRLWGCRYGEADNGEMVNEIYACKLGDFKNWNCFMGLSTDSYSASCGTDGPFTGAITHLGYPLFFKENCVHKVYGNYPSNYQIQTTVCRGVQKESDRSLAIVNETLFYKSNGGVCAYDGSLPVEASYGLGNDYYTDAVAGSYGNKYYISMKDRAGQWHLFVYDVAKAMWHREDDFHAVDFASWHGELYAIDYDTRKILTMLGVGTEEKVKWMVQTGPMGTDMPDMKYISRLTVRMTLPQGSRVKFLAQYDSIGGWEHLGTMVGSNLRSFSIPIRPRRCDHMRIRIEGEGDARIYSITKTIEQGSEIS